MKLDRRQFLKTTALTGSSLFLSSCGWTLADVRPTAKNNNSSNTLYIYTWAGYVDDDLLQKFQEQTGYKAVADVYDSNESMLARLQASGGGGYGIIYPSDYYVKQMADQQLLKEIDKQELIGFQELIPRFQNPSYDPFDRYSIPLAWGTTGFVFNKKKLTDFPEDWHYIWQNKKTLAKRFTLLNDTREVMGATLKMLGYSYNSKDPKQIEAAYKQLQALKPYIASFSTDSWRTQILSGDLLIAMCYSSDANEIMKENPDIAYVVPSSGSSIWVDTLAIPSTTPNIMASYAWINFMLQAEIASDICQRLSFATPNQKALDLLPKDVLENASLFPPPEIVDRGEGITPLPDKITEIYDRYWTQLTAE